MGSQKLRLKILEKIAQTMPNLPTEEVAKSTSVSGSPPSFIASDYYPSIQIGFQSKNVNWINNLANLLNTTMYYISNGEIHLMWMKSNNFNFSSDQVPSVDLKNLMNFSKLLYHQILTNLGNPYKQALTPEQIAAKIKLLNNSLYLNNLSSIQMGGQLSTKINGNVKTLIHDYLLQIK